MDASKPCFSALLLDTSLPYQAASGDDERSATELYPPFIVEQVQQASSEIEADAAYLPSIPLGNAINDAKVLWAAFQDEPPADVDIPRATWFIVVAPPSGGVGTASSTFSPSTAPQCTQLLLRGRAAVKDAPVFNVRIWATMAGKWAFLSPVTGSVTPYSSLHKLLVAELRAEVLQPRGARIVPQVSSFMWLQDSATPAGARHKDKDIALENYRTYEQYSATETTPALPYVIRPFPILLPHVVVSRVTATRSGTEFILGFHPGSETWFLAAPLGTWARTSFFLRTLLASLDDTAGFHVGTGGDDEGDA